MFAHDNMLSESA